MPAASPSRESRVAVEDRLFSLVLALVATENGLRKTEILSTVRGYAERYAVTGLTEALERQFERDKIGLRELGIPLETVDSPDRPGDNQSLRYRIPKALYELPESVRFTPEELALLVLAGEVWREGSLSADSRRALTKLRSLGVEAQEAVIGYAPRIRVREASFEPLQQALDQRQSVRFHYLKPGEQGPRLREVDPHALVQHEGRWHLHGHDHGARAPRTFLLSRIVGEVVPIAGSGFDAPPADIQSQVLADLRAIHERHVATLDVVPGSDAELRLGKRSRERDAATGALLLHYTDAVVLADELAGFGPEVLVLAPAELRDAVRDRLRSVAVAHGGRVG